MQIVLPLRYVYLDVISILEHLYSMNYILYPYFIYG